MTKRSRWGWEKPSTGGKAATLIILGMSSGQSIRVVLVDDHDLLRRGIKTMLETEADIEEVGEGADGTQALPLVEEHLPDVTIKCF